MKSIPLSAVLIGAAAWMIASQSVLAGTQADGSAAFKNLDLAENGSVDVREASKELKLANDFAKFDSDSDGKLSRSEFSAYNAQAGNPSKKAPVSSGPFSP